MTESHHDVGLFEINQHRTWLYILMLGYKKHGTEQCQPIGMYHVTQFGVSGGKERKEKKLKIHTDRAAMMYTPVAQ
jgi:hypothetical protein